MKYKPENHLGLVHTVAGRIMSNLRKFWSSLAGKIEYGDLISWGYLGLVEACNKFDSRKSLHEHFTSYAVPIIRGRILDALNKTFDLRFGLRAAIPVPIRFVALDSLEVFEQERLLPVDFETPRDVLARKEMFGVVSQCARESCAEWQLSRVRRLLAGKTGRAVAEEDGVSEFAVSIAFRKVKENTRRRMLDKGFQSDSF